MLRRGSYQSGKLAKRRRRIFIFKIILGVILAVALIVGTSFWSRSEKFAVTEVKIEGAVFAKAAELEPVAKKLLEGHYWFGYSRSNVALIPKSEIKKAFKEIYPSIDDIKIKSENMHTIVITVEEHEPAARWCGANKGDGCYLLSGDSKIFVKEPLINSFELLTFHGKIEGEPIGATYVSSDFISRILKLSELLKTIDIQITDIYDKDEETFSLVTEEGVKLYIDNADNVETIFDNLSTVIEQEAIHKAQLRNIDYIDLRFGNKVVYKLKEW